ncbi:MAG: AAA family ATPase [Nitrososphaeria archaeon]
MPCKRFEDRILEEYGDYIALGLVGPGVLISNVILKSYANSAEDQKPAWNSYLAYVLYLASVIMDNYDSKSQRPLRYFIIPSSNPHFEANLFRKTVEKLKTLFELQEKNNTMYVCEDIVNSLEMPLVHAGIILSPNTSLMEYFRDVIEKLHLRMPSSVVELDNLEDNQLRNYIVNSERHIFIGTLANFDSNQFDSEAATIVGRNENVAKFLRPLKNISNEKIVVLFTNPVHDYVSEEANNILKAHGIYYDQIVVGKGGKGTEQFPAITAPMRNFVDYFSAWILLIPQIISDTLPEDKYPEWLPPTPLTGQAFQMPDIDKKLRNVRSVALALENMSIPDGFVTIKEVLSDIMNNQMLMRDFLSSNGYRVLSQKLLFKIRNRAKKNISTGLSIGEYVAAEDFSPTKTTNHIVKYIVSQIRKAQEGISVRGQAPIFVLEGKPSAGKTYFASALPSLLAEALDEPFQLWNFNFAEMKGQYLGETERNVRIAMTKILNARNTVILWDEGIKSILEIFSASQLMTMISFPDYIEKMWKNKVILVITANEQEINNMMRNGGTSLAKFSSRVHYTYVPPRSTIEKIKGILYQRIKSIMGSSSKFISILESHSEGETIFSGKEVFDDIIQENPTLLDDLGSQRALQLLIIEYILLKIMDKYVSLFDSTVNAVENIVQSEMHERGVPISEGGGTFSERQLPSLVTEIVSSYYLKNWDTVIANEEEHFSPIRIQAFLASVRFMPVGFVSVTDANPYHSISALDVQDVENLINYTNEQIKQELMSLEKKYADFGIKCEDVGNGVYFTVPSTISVPAENDPTENEAIAEQQEKLQKFIEDKIGELVQKLREQLPAAVQQSAQPSEKSQKPPPKKIRRSMRTKRKEEPE